MVVIFTLDMPVCPSGHSGVLVHLGVHRNVVLLDLISSLHSGVLVV